MIIADSSPLVILAKQGLLELLRKCFGKVIIPENVYEEVMRKQGFPEAIVLEKAIKDKWIVIERAAVSPLLDTKNIGQGEKEAISLAMKRKSLLIIDDDSAKAYAFIFGIESHGTFFVIYLACIRKLIEAEMAKNALDRMIIEGFYVSPELYARFLEMLNSLRRS